MLTSQLTPKANVYGRDWISTAAAEYFMFAFINDCLNGNINSLSLLKNYDFYILPVVNPDGKPRTKYLSTSHPALTPSAFVL